MNFTREEVYSRILELWTSNDSIKRSEANKYLLKFQDSFQAWQICKELLEVSTEPEVQYVAAQTLCQKISNSYNEIQASGGPNVIFENIYMRFIHNYLENKQNSISPLLSKLGEGISFLLILGVTNGSWNEGFETCLRISEPYFTNCGTGVEHWIVLNILRYIPDACVHLDSQKRTMLIQSMLPRLLDFLSESISKTITITSNHSNFNEIHRKILDLIIDILIEYFEKFEASLFNHQPLSSSISKLMKTEIYIAPYRFAELFVRGLPRCSFYMQKQGKIGDSNSIYNLFEDSNGVHVILKFPSDSETTIMMSLLNYLKILFDKLRQIPLPNNQVINNSNLNSSENNSEMIRINTWSTLKMNVPQVELDEETERSILSWSGVLFSLLEGYPNMFIIGELQEVKDCCNCQRKQLENPFSFLPEMLSLLLTLHVRIPGVLVNMWCTLRDLVNEGIISRDQGLSIASLLITPAIQSLATQCRTDFFYWEKLGIDENSVMNSRINNYSNFGLKEITLDDSVQEFLDFLDIATLHISDIYFFLLSLGNSHSQGFITYIQHSLLSCSKENDPIGCVVFLRFSDTLIESTNSIQGAISNVFELACTTLPKTQSCIYQTTLLLQKSAHLISEKEFSPIWLLCLKYLIEISHQSNLLLISSTFEELCQFGVDYIFNNPNCDQILVELSQGVALIISKKLNFSSEFNLYNNISKIDENIGFVGGLIYILCYTMTKSNKPIEIIANTFKSFLLHMIESKIEQIPEIYTNSYDHNINIDVVSQCCWIWSTYVFLKILKTFTYCIEHNNNNNQINSINKNENNNNNDSFISIQLNLLIKNLFLSEDQFFILGKKLRSLIFNSLNLTSESQGYGVVLISSMMSQHSKNISLHNLMMYTRRSFTGNESCLSCPKDIIVSICCLIVRIISCSWLSDVSNENFKNEWCTWEYAYLNIKQSILNLNRYLDKNNNNNFDIKQTHGGATLLINDILKRLKNENKDNFVNNMHNEGIQSILYEFWIQKFISINSFEISRSIEPFFLWQTSLLGNSHTVTLPIQLLLSSNYFIPTLDLTIRSLQFKDKYLLNSILVYLIKLSTAINTFMNSHQVWNDHLGKLITILFSVYHSFEKNLMVQTCRLISSLIEFFPNKFFQTINEMFSSNFLHIYPEIKINPFQNVDQKQQNMIILCLKNLKGPKLRQFLTEIANTINGICSIDECINKYQLLINSNFQSTIINNSNPIVIS